MKRLSEGERVMKRESEGERELEVVKVYFVTLNFPTVPPLTSTGNSARSV